MNHDKSLSSQLSREQLSREQSNRARSDRAQLWQKLGDNHLVSGELNSDPMDATPWFVKVLVVLCGWLSAFFFLGFIGIGIHEILETASLTLALGVLLTGVAFAVLRHVDKQKLVMHRSRLDFQEHLALAVSLVGQLLIIYALYDCTNSASLASLLAGCTQLLVTMVMPNFLHRCISSFLVILFWYFAAADWNSLDGSGFHNGWAGLLMPCVSFCVVWLWLREFTFGKHIRVVQAIAYGFTAALVFIKVSLMFDSPNGLGLSFNASEQSVPMWVGELLTGGVLGYLIWMLLKFYDVGVTQKQAVLAFTGCAVITLFSLASFGFSFSIILLVLGMHGANRLLMGLGIASLLFFVSRYYYFMDTSLLMKSGHLLLLGMVILIGRYAFLRVAFDPVSDHPSPRIDKGSSS